MGVIELLLLSIGLAMDAFAVSVCKGISMKKINCKKSCIIGLWFGGFQALMPTIGYFLGSAFESLVTNIESLDCIHLAWNNWWKYDKRSILQRKRR